MPIRSALLTPAVLGSVLALGSIAGAASASAAETPKAAVPASFTVATAHSSTASTWDWKRGFRSGYGEGFSDARQACRRHGAGNPRHHSRVSDYERGFQAGYDNGFTRAYDRFCGRR